MEGFAEFEFDLPKALKAELINLLDRMPTNVLDAAVTDEIPDVQGVYQLFCDGALVYVGKTDAEAGLRKRLTRHANKIKHRPSLNGLVRFKAVRIMVFTAMDLETQLIGHYGEANGQRPPWNGSGFGANDPGRQREETDKSPDGFDARYPIDIDIPVEYLTPGVFSVSAILKRLKAALPYTLRYETLKNARGQAQRGQPHADLAATSLEIPTGPHTVRQILEAIKEALGDEWQATIFASHVILYKESKSYRYGVDL